MDFRNHCVNSFKVQAKFPLLVLFDWFFKSQDKNKNKWVDANLKVGGAANPNPEISAYS